MSETSSGQKISRSQPQGQDHAAGYVHTLLDDCHLNMGFVPLALADSTGKILCLLNNKPHLPYQRPALPFCKKEFGFHYLLAGLKTAQTCLLLQSQWLSAILPEEYHCIGTEFVCDMEFPELSSIEAFQKWNQGHAGLPLLVQGIGIVDSRNKVCRLKLDLTLPQSSQPDYSKVFSRRFFEPLLVAIQAYNDVVTEWHNVGIMVLPANFIDCLAGMSRQFGTQGVTEYDI